MFNFCSAVGLGGAIDIVGSSPTISNCTIFYCYAGDLGGGIACVNGSAPIIKNVIINWVAGGGGIYVSSSPDVSIEYCDLYNNSGGNFIGLPPFGMGVPTAVNANGDSCDIFMNIFEAPLMVNPTNGDFHLQEDSPCIDAGDPISPLDPDGTVADIGAFYFDQSGIVTPLSVTLTPENPPIILPGSGGAFEFNIEVANNDTVSWTFDVWTMITLPDGRIYGPIIGPINLTFDPGTSINRDRSQAVGFGAPAGIYTYDAYVGTYPDNIIDEDHFGFEKLAYSEGEPIVPAWDSWGESFADGEVSGFSTAPTEFALHPAYPNPFNPTTNIRFDLPESMNVTLIMYDVQGREVARLVDGWRTEGTYESTFDASGLPSGLYFARLTAGDFQQTRKLLLVK